MPGENCSILNCPVSRKAPYKGVGIYKVPSGTNEFESTWRDHPFCHQSCQVPPSAWCTVCVNGTLMPRPT